MARWTSTERDGDRCSLANINGHSKPPAVLTIAGSDSGGDAGIRLTLMATQTDLKVFTAFDCYGMSVNTALTAQNTTSVQGLHPSPPGFTLRAHYANAPSPPPLVVDPVLIQELCPLAIVITRNKLADMMSACDKLVSLGSNAVLPISGHVQLTLADVESLAGARNDVAVVRGALLMDNMEVLQVNEKDFLSLPLVVDVIKEAEGTTLSFSPGIEPMTSNPHPLTRILIQSTAQTSKEYVEHAFVKQLAQGALPKECFLQLYQGNRRDYLYLKYYARAYGLLVAESLTYSSSQSSTQTTNNIINEVSTHKTFCAQWEISEVDLAATPGSPSTTAYGAYLVNIELRGDSAKLIMALAACLLEYGKVCLWFKKEVSKPNSWVKLERNSNLKWYENYSGEQ
ncbi:hypothetical protein BD414DRAFT_557108 [Trametes punicea]|nr:hypothetical protein BD414DRAFT_557108 [Trametes punicea]